MTPVWEPTIDPDPNDPVNPAGDPDEDQAQQEEAGPGQAGGPIQAVETQVLVDGEPVTVTEAARQRPGETAQATRARAIARLREDAREVRDDPWDEPHHHDDPEYGTDEPAAR